MSDIRVDYNMLLSPFDGHDGRRYQLFAKAGAPGDPEPGEPGADSQWKIVVFDLRQEQAVKVARAILKAEGLKV
jgi:hypothetical protein